jgi:hypothetical protein
MDSAADENDFVFEGAAGSYRRVSLDCAAADVSTLISFGSDLDSLGFRLIGDLICSALTNGIVRAYVNPVERTRALLLAGIKDGKLNVAGVFFDTNFADGATLTTTTSRAVNDMPAKGLHRRVYSWHGVHDLYQKHKEHMNELKLEHGDVLAFGDTLLSLAESLDSATIRMTQ